MHRLIQRFTPFIFIGIAIVAFAFGMVLLAYLFLIGTLIGLALFIASWIRDKFFSAKKPAPTRHKKPGRVIDADGWKKL